MRARAPVSARARRAAAGAVLLVAPVLGAAAIDLRIHAGPTIISHVPDSGVGPPSPVAESVGVGIWQDAISDAFSWRGPLT